MARKKAPAWITTHLAAARAALGTDGPVEEYVVRLVAQVDPDEPATLGVATVTACYHRAQITLRRDIRPNAEGYEALTHEIVHTAMPRQAETVGLIIDLLPKRHRKHALALWSAAWEADTTAIARGLTPLLRAHERKPTNE